MLLLLMQHGILRLHFLNLYILYSKY